MNPTRVLHTCASTRAKSAISRNSTNLGGAALEGESFQRASERNFGLMAERELTFLNERATNRF
jgi:hypothetical protein